MAVISAGRRDLDGLAAGLRRWLRVQRPDAMDLRLSPLETNPSSGFSSETVFFTVAYDRDGAAHEEPLVLRLPPSGGGMFPEYDLARQAATHALLAGRGIPAPSPTTHEPDPTWIGSEFLLMPRLPGRVPGDYVYMLKGWVKDAEPSWQRRFYESFADALVRLHQIDLDDLDPTDAALLARPAGVGLAAEARWWADYLSWATDGSADAEMAAAYRWVDDTVPADPAMALTWGDPRFANAAFDDAGQVVGVLDWEQAAIGPPELDVAWWLETRSQSRAALGIAAEAELPGFLDDQATVARVEAGLGRPLRDLAWHRTFAAIRMGTCVVALQHLLRRSGQADHFLLQAVPLPPAVVALVDGLA